MSKQAAETEATLWEQLPKADQEKIRRHLGALNKQEPQQKARSKNGTFSLKGYIRCELSASDKEAFRAWEIAQDDAACLSVVVKLVDSGYLLKVGESGQGHQASLCASSTSQDWDGYVLTAHASSSMRAVALLVFKHEVLMHGDWSAWLADEGEDFFR